MIAFENKAYLHAGWGILLLVLLFVLYRIWQARAQQKLGDKDLVRQLILGKSSRLAITKFTLLLLAFSCFVIALANPYLTTREVKNAPIIRTDIVFAIDVSNSMLAADAVPNRLAQAKQFINEVTKNLKGEQVGLVVFAGKAYPYLPLTADYETVRGATKTIIPEMVRRQGTSLAEALKMSVLLLNSKKERTRFICVLSDGESHQQNYGSLADSLSKAGIDIFSFGLGTTAGDYIPVQKTDGSFTYKKDKTDSPIISRLHEESLVRLVRDKPDRYQPLNGSENALGFVEELRKLPSGATVEQAAKQEYFQYFIIAGLVLLLLELAIAPGKKYTWLRSNQL